MDHVKLMGFPMPPSINAAYANRTGPGVGRFKTPIYRAFERDVAYWVIRNRKLVHEAALFVQQDLQDQCLVLDSAFCFPAAKLISKKKKRLKTLDVDNRLKAAADALGKVLAFNDCLIGLGTYQKVALEKAESAFACFRLRWAPIPREISWLSEP